MYTKLFTGQIDYLFYSHNSLGLAGVLQLPEEHVIRQDCCLPSKRFPSDHLRLEAKFFFK